MNLNNKRVLVIAPSFFGYDAAMVSEFRRRGAHVDVIRDRPFNSAFMAAVTRFSGKTILPLVDRILAYELNKFSRTIYDVIFVVNGQTLSTKFVRQLRTDYPSACFVLYIWDSLSNRKSIVEKIPLFDIVSTFEHTDALTYGINHRPLFFSPSFGAMPQVATDVDISFIGTAHSDRARIVHQIDAALPKTVTRFWYLYLQAQWVFYAYKVTNPAYKDKQINQFKFEPMDQSGVQSVFARSRAILDIEHPRQTGQTFRTFETLGSAKKLITTNKLVERFDFYNPTNILIIDRKNPQIPDEFLNSPYERVNPDIYARYTLKAWMTDVLDPGGSNAPEAAK